MRSQLRPRVLLPTAVLALLGIGFGAFAFSGTPGSDVAESTLKRPAGPAPAAAAAEGPKLKGWAKQANAICTDLNEDVAALGVATSRERLLELLPQSLGLAGGALTELRALPAPAAAKPRIDKMLGLFERFVATEQKAAAALAGGDVGLYVQLNGRAFALNDRGNKIARALGANACAEGGSEDSELVRALERNAVVVAVLYTPDAAVDMLAVREARAAANAVDAGFVALDVYDTREIAPVAADSTIRSAPAVLVFARHRGAVTQFSGYADRETVAQAAANAAV